MYTVYLKVHGQRDIANLMIKTLCKSQLYDRELSAENHGAFSSLHHGVEVGIKSNVLGGFWTSLAFVKSYLI